MGIDFTSVLSGVADVLTTGIKYPKGTYLVLIEKDEDTGAYKRWLRIDKGWKKTSEITDPTTGAKRDLLVIFESTNQTFDRLNYQWVAADVVFPNGRFERYERKEFKPPEGETRKWKFYIQRNMHETTPTPP